MKTSIIPIILLLTCACNYTPPDPCSEGSPLGAQLSPEQLSELCESGETGGEQSGDLICAANAAPPMPFCAVASSTSEPVDDSVYETRPLSECHSTSGTFAHVPNWSTPVNSSYSGRLDTWCPSANENWPDGDNGHAPDGVWSLCQNGGGGQMIIDDQRYYPATVWEGAPSATWPSQSTCLGLYDEKIGSCPLGLVAVGDSSDRYGAPSPMDAAYSPLEWTCACESDDDCPGPTVCEGGYYLDGVWPRPSLCTWDNASGDSVAPVGPAAYGLDEWRDGIMVNGDTIVMTPMFFVGLAQGVINDAHSFGLAGELTECGPESLCAHIGLGVGDIVQAEQRHSDELESGETVAIDVVSPDGSVRILQVSVSPF